MLNFNLLGVILLLQDSGNSLTSLLPMIILITVVAGGIYLARQTGNKTKITEELDNDIDPSLPRQASALMKRYRDAYLVAKVTVGIGSTIKIIGFGLAAIILLGTFAFANLAGGQRGMGNDASGGVFIVVLFIGGINAFIVGFVSYIIGVIVSANGQALKATLDNTVGNSLFLTDDLKAKIMYLPKA